MVFHNSRARKTNFPAPGYSVKMLMSTLYDGSTKYKSRKSADFTAISERLEIDLSDEGQFFPLVRPKGGS
jgi:hypothetical protein